MREGLTHAISQEAGMIVAAQAGDGLEAVQQFRTMRPHVVLIDLQMPRMNGLEAIAAIRDIDPAAVLIVLTTYSGDARVMQALKLGAMSYLLKSSTTGDILLAIRAAAEGRQVLAADIRRDITMHAGWERVTKRELSVLALAAVGYGNREIGEALCVSEETVKSRIRSILGKLDASDRTHAVMLAIKRGFLEL
jgi:DNA-binding NarL/FixJ family response regulator